MKRRTLAATIGLALAGVLVFSACAPAAPPSGAGSPGGGTAAGGPSDATLSIATTTDVVNFNPLIGTSLSDNWVTNLMYPRILTMTPEGKKVPSVATDWGYTDTTHGFFQIRDDMSWSDGKPLTAKDVAFTLNAAKKDKPAGILYGQLANFASAEAVSDTRVEVTLTQPDSSALPNIGFWTTIVPEHIFGPAGNVATFANDSDWVSAGPYKLDAVAAGQSYTFSRVDDYPLVKGGKPMSAKVVYRVYPDVNTEVLALRNGDIDLIANPIPPAQVATLKTTDGVALQEVPGLGFTTLKLNQSRKPLDNPAVREAIAHAIDNNAIRKVVLQGQGESTGSTPLLPVMKDVFDPSIKEYAYDPELSRSVLEKAGFTADGSGKFPISLRLMYSLQDPVISQWASMVKDSAAEAGITIELEGIERNTYLARTKSGDYDLYAGSFAITDDPAMTLAFNYLPGGANNYSLTDDPKLSDVITRLRVSTDPAEQVALAREAAKTVHDNYYDNVLYVQNLYVAYRKGLTGFTVLPSALQSVVNPLSVASMVVPQ